MTLSPGLLRLRASHARSLPILLRSLCAFALSLPLVSCIGSVDAPAGSIGTCDGTDFDCTNNAIGGDKPGTPDTPGIGDPNTPDGVGWSTRYPKLSNEQWENTVRDAFYLDAPPGLAKDFTQEPGDKQYVTLAAADQTIAGDAWSRYQTAAESVAETIASDDAKLAKVLKVTEGSATEQGAQFIASLGRRVYRRALSADEQAGYEALFAQGQALVGGDAVKAGARLVIAAMLQSPHFLYRVEGSAVPDDESDRKAFLSGDELATRLSYTLWNTMPSDELFAAADGGELDTKKGVASWARKMLDDPRASFVLLSFHEQTYQTSSFGSQDKDPELGVDPAELEPVVKQEIRSFFEYVINEKNGGIRELLTDRSAFVNELTAPLYGLKGIIGDELERVQLDANKRAGFLTQVGFLTKNATRTTSDPVHRGLAVVRQVLCDEPDPPPMMFELPSPVPGSTTREVYEKATRCGVGCHDTLINPPGFAFETFDTLGRSRTTEAGKPIDAQATLTIRQGYTSEEKRDNPKHEITFDGAVELVTKLAKEKRVHECYARNWMTYALARDLDPVERGAYESLRDRSLEQSSARELIVALVQLDTFRSRVSE